jgi:hypothetical protein
MIVPQIAQRIFGGGNRQSAPQQQNPNVAPPGTKLAASAAGVGEDQILKEDEGKKNKLELNQQRLKMKKRQNLGVDTLGSKTAPGQENLGNVTQGTGQDTGGINVSDLNLAGV